MAEVTKQDILRGLKQLDILDEEMQKSYLISTRTHFKIVGTEVVGISAFLLAILGLQARVDHGLGPSSVSAGTI